MYIEELERHLTARYGEGMTKQALFPKSRQAIKDLPLLAKILFGTGVGGVGYGIGGITGYQAGKEAGKEQLQKEYQKLLGIQDLIKKLEPAAKAVVK